MDGLKSSLEESISSINETTELFYQQKMEDGYKKLEGTINLLSQTINDLYTYKLEGHETGVDENQLIGILTEAMNAIEEKDTVLLSDILQYDLKEVLDQILLQLT